MTDLAMFITSRLGTCHAVRFGTTCNAARYAPKRKEVTALQALVYKLGACATCWPVRGVYDRHIRGQ